MLESRMEKTESCGREALSSEEIQKILDDGEKAYDIRVFPVLDSTNREVKRQAEAGAGEGLVVLAEEQTMGRGRLGRSFYSPSASGIYMSVLFRPLSEQAENIVLMTTAASVAVSRAISRVLKEEAEIKWVNDIYIRGKKVCGILTEAVTDPDSGEIDRLIVGIGINCFLPENGFPEEISGTAGVVCQDDRVVSRNRLAAEVIRELFHLYPDPGSADCLEEYRRRSNVIGKNIRFLYGDKWTNGQAVDIDDVGGLIVRLEDGSRKILRTGEITLRVREERVAKPQQRGEDGEQWQNCMKQRKKKNGSFLSR